jgi:hypothetical protein
MSFVNLSTKDDVEQSSNTLAQIINTLVNLPEKSEVPRDLITLLVPEENMSDFEELNKAGQMEELMRLTEIYRKSIIEASKKFATVSDQLTSSPTNLEPTDIPSTWGNVPGASDELIAAIHFLEEANGHDAYSAEAIALGSLTRKEHLALPVGFTTPEIHPSEIGSAAVYKKFQILDLIQIYALNKAIAPANTNPVLFALARLEAVKLGWITASGQKEIQYLERVQNAEAIFAADLKANQEAVSVMRNIAFLTPFYAEWVFRTTGHHYISGDAGTYTSKYEAIARASLGKIPSLSFPSEIAYHTLFHWISPARAYEALVAQKDTERIPDAIKIRMKAAPAGTALITTSAAVFESMKTANFFPEFVQLTKGDVEEIMVFSDAIKSEPTKWHKTPSAYGMAPMSEEKQNRLEIFRRKAALLAPITQAYINALMKNAPLGRAKTLDKHSMSNPLLKEKAQKFFKSMAKTEVSSFANLFGS